jgi:hypothetical protein
VLIVGGFLTEPVNYRRVRERLLVRGAGAVTIAGIHIPDWLAAGVVGFGPILARTGREIRRAWLAAGRRPIIVVGHSGGGILARLAMSDTPLNGHRGGVAEAVGCLVTLGTPHELARARVRVRHRGIEAAQFLDRTTPGAWHQPATAYLTVASDFIKPRDALPGPRWDRFRARVFWSLVGPIAPAGSDGIVSVSAAHLDGARQLTFSDVRHGHIGGPWYGDPAVIDRWWPHALELWGGAVEARATAAASKPRDGEGPAVYPFGP